MSPRSFGRALGVVMLLLLAAPYQLQAQGWSVDVSAGRLVYDRASATVGTDSVVGTIQYDAARGSWVYGAAALPIGDEATFWWAGGAGGRFATRGSRRASAGAELGAHGFWFRDALADRAGEGGTLEAIPFARVSSGASFFEVRGGWRGQTLAFAGTRENRGVLEAGARVGYGTIVRVSGDARWVRATEGTYPVAGVTLNYDGRPVQVWAHAGKWLRDDLDRAEWAGGFAVTLGARATIWASVRQEAPDPLYWNPARRTWSVGMTTRVGRLRPAAAPAQAAQAGVVTVRLREMDAPAGAVWIAGDFNGWTPVPMERDDHDWVAKLQLRPGVYHYAFRSATGEWFVPSSVPGRVDDGMGGYSATLLVR